VACESPAARNSVIIGVGSDVSTLLPLVEATSLDADINALLYRGLNSARWAGGRIEYMLDDLSLAERWEFGPDSTTLTYHIRPDAVWSDGEPIDADDVVFTYELARQPDVASRYYVFWEELDSVAALDDRRVTFYFKRRSPRMLLHSGAPIIPKHIFDSVPADGASLAGHPSVVHPDSVLVVSGPFRVATMVPGERLVLEPNPRTFSERPALDRVVFRIIPEATTLMIEFMSGRADVIYPVSLTQTSELAEATDVRLATTGPRFYEFIPLNGSAFAPFKDSDVRRAISYAIDREGILAGQGITDYASPAAGPYPPIFPDLADPSVQPDAHLPDSARAILSSKGWRDSDGDGVLDKDGRPFHFTLVTEAGRRSDAATIIQSQLAGIGIDVELRLLEHGTLIDRVFVEPDFQAALVGWAVTLDPEYLVQQFARDAYYNVTDYTSVAVDSLIPLARSAASLADAAPYWRAVGATVARDRPYAFLWFYTEVAALSDRVRDTRIDIYSVFQNLHQWRIEP
jgi:peptide/nickel transport system substrate-binding protein